MGDRNRSGWTCAVSAGKMAVAKSLGFVDATIGDGAGVI
jgi:hypothetical protein